MSKSLKRYLICTLAFVSFNLNSQEAKLHEFVSRQFDAYQYPLQLVSQTDSCVIVLSEVKDVFGSDLMLSKYMINKQDAVYETRLHVDSLFHGNFNPKEINFYFFENKQTVSCFVERKTKTKSIIYAKPITENGKPSKFTAIDSVEKTDRNMNYFGYRITQTSTKKHAIIVCRRDYLSGFRRDKCILISLPDLEKVIDMELPKNSAHISENYNFETDFQGNVFYAVFNKNHTEKDSLNIFKIDLKTKSLSLFKLPEANYLVCFKPLFSNQILLYGITNLRYSDNDSIKKALFYRRVSLSTGKVLLDMNVPLSPVDQYNLTYSYKSLSKEPVSKIFTLVSDDIIDGRLITVYEHNHHSLALSDLNRRITILDPQNVPSTVTEKLEYLSASFNLSTNEVEQISLTPKKIIYNTNRYTETETAPFSSVYFNNGINLSFHEHRANIGEQPNKRHYFNQFKQATNIRKVNTVIYDSKKKTLISFNLRQPWRPLNSTNTFAANKTYYFSYTKKSLRIAYYNLAD